MGTSTRVQVTCLCKAYSFPHRVGGGLCTGSEWAKSYRENVGDLCQTCNSEWQGECDVVNGAETIKWCPAYQEHLHYQPDTRYPSDPEDEYKQLMESYYE